MFRAVVCSSSGHIVLLRHLISSPRTPHTSLTTNQYFRPPVSPLSTGVLYGRLQRVTIPDAVIIQCDLLKMSIVLLETCRGLKCNIYIVIE